METGSPTHTFLPLPILVIHSGDYFLFESDSEEEEEALPEDSRPTAQSAFQVRWSHVFLLCLWSLSGAVCRDGHQVGGSRLLHTRKPT